MEEILLENDPIEKLDLSKRTYNCLKSANINQIKDLVGTSLYFYRNLKNFGYKSYRELVCVWTEYQKHKISCFDKILSAFDTYGIETCYHRAGWEYRDCDAQNIKFVW